MVDLEKVIESLKVIRDYCNETSDCKKCGCFDFEERECGLGLRYPNGWYILSEPVVKIIK